MDLIREKIRKFITRFFQNVDLQDNQDIFSLGFINSLFAMQLVLFVEQEFSISIENEDLDLDNFRTIDAVAHLVVRKQATHSDAEL